MKECPFCHNILESQFKVVVIYDDNSVNSHIQCKKCGARGPTGYDDRCFTYAKDNAYKKWDSRDC